MQNPNHCEFSPMLFVTCARGTKILFLCEQTLQSNTYMFGDVRRFAPTMSSRSMSEFQDDFLLDVSDSKFFMQMIAPHNAFGGSSRSLTSEKICLVHDQPDCLKNEIKPEVSAMIAVWKSSNIIPRQELGRDGMSGDHQTDSMRAFEPYRCCTTSQPPKRFYRTFWRSIARRALQQAVDHVKSNVRGIRHSD